MKKEADWQRIGDDEIAAFGKRSMAFAGSVGNYRIDVDERRQDRIWVTSNRGPLAWTVSCKRVLDAVFRLEGMTDGDGDPYEDIYWFELTLSIPAVINFWGDGVIVHEDHEMLHPGTAVTFGSQ
jgi:hypothetical protein